MKISYNWLKEYMTINISAKDLAEKNRTWCRGS